MRALATCALLWGVALPQLARAEAAPDVWVISGRVVDADAPDFGVAGATARVGGVSARADEDGRFVLRVRAETPLVVHVSAPGYRATRVPLPAREGARAPLVIALRWREPTRQVTTLERAAPAQTASTTRLTRRELAAAPHRTAEEVLRQAPGLTLVQHGSEGKGYQYFLRGFDAIHGADLEITVEGLPVNEWSNVHAQGYLDLGVVLPELVQGVDVTKGPFALEQGAFAMAGSAAYRLGVEPGARGWRGAYTIGTTGRHRIFAGYAPVEGGAFVGAAATHDEGFGQRRGLARVVLNARTPALSLGRWGELEALALAHAARFELPGTVRRDDVLAGRIGFYDSYDQQLHGDSARALLSLTHTVARPSWRLRTRLYGGLRRLDLLENFTGFLINPSPDLGDRRQQRHTTKNFGAQVRLDGRATPTLRWRLGVGLRGDVFAQQEALVDQRLDAWQPRRDLSGVQSLGHALGGARWTPHRRVRLDAGARLDVAHVRVTDALADDQRATGTLAAASPRVTARWRPLDALGLFAAWGRGFRPPEARAFSTFDPGREGVGDEVIPNAPPAMTTSNALETGARWHPTRWLDVSLSGFGAWIARESVFDHVSGVNLELNATRRLGAELVLRAEPTPWLTLQGDATATHARFVASGNPVPFAPPLVLGARAILGTTSPLGWHGGLRALLLTPRPLPHGARGATLLMTDATLSHAWTHLRLQLAAENLLNQRVQEGEYHHASRWQPSRTPSQLPTLHLSPGSPRVVRLTIAVVY